MRPVDVVLVDDHALVRQSLARFIEDEPNFRIKAQFSNANDTLAALPSLQADLMLIDISLPDHNGLELLRQVQQQRADIRCIMLSMYEHFHYVQQAIELGAKGYVSKAEAAEEILRAIATVMQDDNYLSIKLAKSLHFSGQRKSVGMASLTPREVQIFALLALGNTVKTVARQTGTMPKTVLTHRANIFRKLGVSNQFDLLKVGLKEGLIDVSDLT